MTEEDFIAKIIEKRRKAIERSDRNHSERFLVRSPWWIKVAMVVVVAYLICSFGLRANEFTREPIKTFKLEKHIHNNITQNIIKGKQEMVCIQDLNSTKMVCYEEVSDGS